MVSRELKILGRHCRTQATDHLNRIADLEVRPTLAVALVSVDTPTRAATEDGDLTWQVETHVPAEPELLAQLRKNHRLWVQLAEAIEAFIDDTTVDPHQLALDDGTPT